MKQPFKEYRDTPLWRALAGAMKELEANRDIVLETAPEYVIGHLCQQLVVRKLVVPAGLEYDPQ